MEKDCEGAPVQLNWSIYVAYLCMNFNSRCNLPSIHMHDVEQQSSGWSCEQLEAALGVFYIAHAQKPDEEMETQHQERTEQGTLEE